MSLQSREGPEGPPGEMGKPGMQVKHPFTNINANGEPEYAAFRKTIWNSELVIVVFVALLSQGPLGEPGDRGRPAMPGDLVSTETVTS